MEGKLNIKYLCLSFLQKELTKGSIIDIWQDRLIQKQPPEVFFEKSLLKHFAIFIDKLPCRSIFLISCRSSGNFNKKRLQHRYFPVNISKYKEHLF